MDKVEGYDILECMGGINSFATVYKLHSKETKEFAVISSRCFIQSCELENKLPIYRNEIEKVKQLGEQYGHLVKLLTFQEKQGGVQLYIRQVTELCSFGDLESYAQKYYLTTGHHLKILCEMSNALAFMHEQSTPIIHGNLKPSKILFTEENGKHVLKVADFGLASINYTRNLISMMFMPPEKIYESNRITRSKKEVNKTGAQDAFSYGILAYQIIDSDPKKGIEWPEVIKTGIGKLMIRRSRDNRIIIKDSDSAIVKKTKEVIQTVIQFDPMHRNTMAEVTRRLKEIMIMLPQQPGVPELQDDVNKQPVPSRIEVEQELSSSKSAQNEVCSAVIDEHFLRYRGKPTVKKVIAHQLDFHPGGFCPSLHMGFSSSGVVMENKFSYHDQLYLLSMTETGYRTIWERPRPAGVKRDSYKYMLQGGNIVLSNGEDLTVVYDKDLDHIDTHTGDLSRTCGVIQGDRLLYRKALIDNKWTLCVFDCNEYEDVYTLPVSVDRASHISTASHADKGWFVIADTGCDRMYLLTADYQLHSQVELGCKPHWTNSVCCVDNVIAVVNGDGENIVFYNWAGEVLNIVGRKGLRVGGLVRGVGCGSGDGRIQVYTDDYRLHVYTIC